MAVASALDRARTAYAARAWGDSFTAFGEADAASALQPDDLSTMATCAYLAGDSDTCIELLGRAYQGFAAAGSADRAAGCAYWLAFALLNRGEQAQASGWVSRAMQLLDDAGTDCVERAYLDMLAAITLLMQGDPPRALPAIEAVIEAARRFDDVNLTALGALGKGQTLIALERTEEGIALLDQVMVSATSGELSEAVAGLAYCAIIAVCQDILDIR